MNAHKDIFPVQFGKHYATAMFKRYVLENRAYITMNYGKPDRNNELQWTYCTVDAWMISPTRMRFLTYGTDVLFTGDNSLVQDTITVDYAPEDLHEHVVRIRLDMARAEYDRRDAQARTLKREQGILAVHAELFPDA